MKISLHWLSDFVTWTETDPQKIADRLTEATGEVEEVKKQGQFLDHCCVGKVVSMEKHPNADKLTLCKVQTDSGVKNIVCGGSNLRQGMRVALAHVGATVRWHGTDVMTLQKTKIRGEESEGMICTAEELDLVERFPMSTERSIMDLGDGEEDIGADLRTFLGLTDVVFHVDNHAITHRADLFSHLGFARECVALGLATWKAKPKAKKFPFASAKIPFAFKNEIPDLVPRYNATVLKIDGIGETPEWMKKRLEATGWRSVSLPVDITNYVTMELGMPLHSFDVDDLKGDVHVRLSKKGEKITTLDGQERPLPEGAIVLSDDTGIFDLLGIMGGLRSSTKPSTKRIYLHSAAVDPVSIRRAIVATGHRTDAATVYEKGIPLCIVEQGFLRALELFLELVPGATIVSEREEWGEDAEAPSIALDVDHANRTLGTALSPDRIAEILTDLEFTIAGKKGKKELSMTVTPPLHRLGDIHGPRDLVEEIGRIEGYNRIEAAIPEASITLPPRDYRLFELRRALGEQGFTELLPLSLLSPELVQRSGFTVADTVRIQNPLGEELSVMQPSVLPSLLEHAERERKLVVDGLQTFTSSNVFSKKGEHRELGVLWMQQGAGDVKTTPLLLLKRALTHAFQKTGSVLETRRMQEVPVFAHPGRIASLSVHNAGKGTELHPSKEVGILFELHPDVLARFGLPARTTVALVNVQDVLALPAMPVIASPLPVFPAITYDVTVPMSHSEETERMLQTLRDASELLEDVSIIDLFTPKGGKEADYQLTLRFTYRSPERTLTEEEVKKKHEEVLRSLGK